MLFYLTSKATTDQINSAAEDLDGYIKFVVDLTRKVITIGGVRHVQGEELLLKEGSQQEHLWGGGIDLETHQIDYDSMINIRPHQGNTSREVLSQEIREQMKTVVINFISL